MQEKDFNEILKRYLDNTCTPQEKELVERWFEAIGKGEQKLISDHEERLVFDAYEEGFNKIVGRSHTRTISFAGNRWIKLAAAILIILGPVLYMYVVRYDDFSDNDLADVEVPILKRVVNDESSAFPVQLHDGSTVVLNPGATLTYGTAFDGGVREVFLEGEAFFNVAHDSLLPFVVKTGQLMTTVLGTSFTVKAMKGEENVIITVKTGKVLVTQINGGSGVESRPALLTPNQQAICNIQNGSISRSRVEDIIIAAEPDAVRRYYFHEASIVEILRELERQHDFKIVFDESDFAGCLLSTSFLLDEGLFRRLDVVCKAIGASYKIEGLSVFVTGKSCVKSR